MLTEKQLSEIRDRSEKATAGPWYADGWAVWDDLDSTYAEIPEESADAIFIAHPINLQVATRHNKLGEGTGLKRAAPCLMKPTKK